MARYPFQKLCCVQPVDGRPPFLLASSGPIIYSFDLKDGSVLSQWPREDDEEDVDDAHDKTANGEEGRPTKRRRVDTRDAAEGSRVPSDESIEIISERKKGERRGPKRENSKMANVTHMSATSDGTSLVVVTAEDKAVSVFAVRGAGVLHLQSQRSMPKKMCGIVLSPDEQKILVGDKFGDVYALPLHPTEGWVPKKLEQNDRPQGDYTPSATELTVHTRGNLEALRQQRQLKVAQPKKEGPDFELKLLLGHVSLLTDVAITEIQDGLKRKQYILTADRDEHIRVSRGIAQAHIIENYCLGHREFVSKLCVIPWQPELLVAGSGEPSLKVYDWRTGRLVDEELFQGAVQQDISKVLSVGSERSLDHLAVSNIWSVHYSASEKSPYSRRPPRLLLVALEGLPLLLSYTVSETGQLRHHQSLTFGGNVLDVAVGPALWDIVVSIDSVHKPGSMKEIRPDETPATEVFETYELFSNLSGDANGSSQPAEDPTTTDACQLRWERSSLAVVLNNSVSHSCEEVAVPLENSSRDKNAYSVLGESLYGLENLRKKRGQNAAEAEDEENEDEAPPIVAGDA